MSAADAVAAHSSQSEGEGDEAIAMRGLHLDLPFSRKEGQHEPDEEMDRLMGTSHPDRENARPLRRAETWNTGPADCPWKRAKPQTKERCRKDCLHQPAHV